ncbi:MAG: trigger factor [Candidatus Omnitrophota bacterium]|nr:trigger factor [Candidatus Omnitrophota bacterium]
MKVSVKKVDSLRRELKFEIPRDRVSKKLEEIYAELGKVAKIRGFRPGKAPRHLLEQHHGPLAREEMLKKLIPEVYQEGIEQEKIDAMDLPDIQDVEFKDGGISFVAKVDIKPEVTVKDYKGIAVKRKSSKVTDEELGKMLDYFKKSQGQDKDVPVDDALARGLGYPSLEEFKQSLARQMEMDKDRHNRLDIENQVLEAVIKNAKLDVPQSLVNRQLEHRLKEIRQRMQSQRMKEEDIKTKEEELRKDLHKASEKDVKVYLIFDKIAQMEGITAQEGESLPGKVMELLLKEAKWEEEK